MSCVVFAFLQMFAPHTHSKKLLKNQKNSLFSHSDVALLSSQNSSKFEEFFSAFIAILDCMPCNLGTGLFTRTQYSFLVQHLGETFSNTSTETHMPLYLLHLLESLGE
jgi:hypothetical protein